MPSEKKRSNKQVEMIKKYKAVFTTDVGKEVLYDIMKSGFMLNAEYKGDPSEVVFREGARSIPTRILNLLKIDEGKYQNFLEERRQEEENYEY